MLATGNLEVLRLICYTKAALKLAVLLICAKVIMSSRHFLATPEQEAVEVDVTRQQLSGVIDRLSNTRHLLRLTSGACDILPCLFLASRSRQTLQPDLGKLTLPLH